MMAIIIQCPAEGAYVASLRFLNSAIMACKAGESFTDDSSSKAAGLQEWTYESANHGSKNGYCRCAHHKLAYRLGELAEFPEEIKDMPAFLQKTKAMLMRLIARTKACKAKNALKGGISKVQ